MKSCAPQILRFYAAKGTAGADSFRFFLPVSWKTRPFSGRAARAAIWKRRCARSKLFLPLGEPICPMPLRQSLQALEGPCLLEPCRPGGSSTRKGIRRPDRRGVEPDRGGSGIWPIGEPCSPGDASGPTVCGHAGQCARVNRCFLSDGFVEQVNEAIEASALAPGRLGTGRSAEAVFFGDTNVVDRTLCRSVQCLACGLTLDELVGPIPRWPYFAPAPFDMIKIDPEAGPPKGRGQ